MKKLALVFCLALAACNTPMPFVPGGDRDTAAPSQPAQPTDAPPPHAASVNK